MAEKQAPLENFAAIARALDNKATVEQIAAAVQTIVTMYRTIKADTEAERIARDQQFTALMQHLTGKINEAITRIINGKDGAAGPRGPQGVAGRDGQSITGPAGRDGTNGSDGSPDSADDIRNKLELLAGKDRLNVSAIDGLTELLAEFTKKNGTGSRIQMGGTTGRDLFNDIDLSPQLDGVTSTFQIHAVYNIISVHLSSFPHALRKNIDFTYTPTTITFDPAQIDPATALAAGQTCVLTVVNA